MLAHQLPTLPPLDSFWRDLKPFFDWLEGDLKEQHLVSPLEMDGEIFQPDRISSAFTINAVIHKIQFAAANRICIELTYDNKTRIIEPLSFRQTSTGNKLFYGHEIKAGYPKAFTLQKIQGVTITNTPYKERQYPIEINASGNVTIPPLSRKK